MSADFARTPKGRLAGVIFWSRWLLLPIYLGLIVVQGVYAWKFLSQLYKLLANLTSLTEIEIMLTVLGLIDVVMIANLLLMVTVGGYETFVSRLRVEQPGSAGVAGSCQRLGAQGEVVDGHHQHFVDPPAANLHQRRATAGAHHQVAAVPASGFPGVGSGDCVYRQVVACGARKSIPLSRAIHPAERGDMPMSGC